MWNIDFVIGALLFVIYVTVMFFLVEALHKRAERRLGFRIQCGMGEFPFGRAWIPDPKDVKNLTRENLNKTLRAGCMAHVIVVGGVTGFVYIMLRLSVFL